MRPSFAFPGIPLVVIAFTVLLTGTVLGAAGAADESGAERIAAIREAVVGVHARVSAEARSAETLGRLRSGNGVVIGDDGLVLTIGYLIAEAEAIWITTLAGDQVPATPVAYDFESGFGLVRTLTPLDVKPLELGESEAIKEGAPVLVVSQGGSPQMTPAQVTERGPFAGYWEYLLENAIFTTPPHPSFGGAALIAVDARLVGIGSLVVGDTTPDDDERIPGNMFVPVEVLKPILADLLDKGRRSTPGQPWLGLRIGETGGRVFITRVVPGGPAAGVGIKPGDVIMGVNGKAVSGMVDFFRKVWGIGDAGAEVPIDVMSAGGESLAINRIVIHSGDRHEWLKPKGGL